MSQRDAIEAAIAPTLDRLGFELVDVELTGSGRAPTLRVSVDRPGGVDLDAITEASEALNPMLDREPLVSGSYTLEVSSPGVERPLRRPDHFARAVGETISIKTRGSDGTVTRRRAELVGASPSEVTIDVEGNVESLGYDDVLQARTVFEWGPADRPAENAKKRGRQGQRGQRSRARRSAR